MRWLDGIINSMEVSLSKLWEMEDREAWHAQSMQTQRVGHDWATEQLNIYIYVCVYIYMYDVYKFIYR